MLGFGWYVWDEKCPSGRRCVPPIYGKFSSAYIKVPENSPRTNGTNQVEAVSAPWKDGIPRGNDVCIKFGSGGNKKHVTPLKKRTTTPKRNHHHQSKNEPFPEINPTCSCNPPPSYFSQHRAKSFVDVGCGGSSKKQLYNVMWDPKIARGPTLIQFEEAQRAKWKRQVDAHRAHLLRDQIRRRRMKMKEAGYLDTKSNPMRRIVYPNVTIKKEPLTNSSFALFLTEQCETVERMNAGQVTDDRDYGPPRRQNKKSFSFGISVGAQTDEDGNKRQEVEDWIASTMTEKIPQQAVLELQEEAELEAVKGEQQRYELVFLYRKWQEMKESQWNEYLRAWNELRMNEILDQNAYLQEQQERILVIGFCRNVVSSCFQTTFHGMKQDGFINEHGVPYGELKEINDSLDYQKKTENKFVQKQLARKVIDSTLINAVVHRFSQHMFAEYGRPHGAWLHRLGRHSAVNYDIDLQRYLEGRWLNRREELSMQGNSMNTLFSETSLLDIFDYYKDPKKPIGEVRQTFKEGQSEADRIIKSLISKKRLGRRTGKSTMFSGTGTAADNEHDNENHEHRFSNDDDVSTLYKRQTRWSKLEMADENHHQQQNLQQKNISSLGNDERGSRLVSDAKRTRGGTKGKSTGGGGARFSEEKDEVDSDKLGEPDGKNEMRGSKLSSGK